MDLQRLQHPQILQMLLRYLPKHHRLMPADWHRKTRATMLPNVKESMKRTRKGWHLCLLKRANLDEGRGDTGIEPPSIKVVEEDNTGQTIKDDEGALKPTGEDGNGVPAPKPTGKRVRASKTVNSEDDKEPTHPINLQPASQLPTTTEIADLPQQSVHFPAAP